MNRRRMGLAALIALIVAPACAWAAVPTPAGASLPADKAPLLPTGVYTVQPGDTLWDVSHRLGVPLEQLIADNDVTDPHFLKPGQVLRYPAWLAQSGPSLVSRSDLGTDQPTTKTGTFLHCTLTAYTAGYESTGKRPEDPGYGITSTGVPAREGVTVAVDPHVIPYGSRIYIPGLGWRIAQDTGSAIIGNHIDVFFDNVETAIHFGVKTNVPVYIVPPSRSSE
jgi:3D (Asp-Asp-Asp) domain-containing protein